MQKQQLETLLLFDGNVPYMQHLLPAPMAAFRLCLLCALRTLGFGVLPIVRVVGLLADTMLLQSVWYRMGDASASLNSCVDCGGTASMDPVLWCAASSW
jgi:hypothetical protein